MACTGDHRQDALHHHGRMMSKGACCIATELGFSLECVQPIICKVQFIGSRSSLDLISNWLCKICQGTMLPFLGRIPRDFFSNSWRWIRPESTASNQRRNNKAPTSEKPSRWSPQFSGKQKECCWCTTWKWVVLSQGPATLIWNHYWRSQEDSAWFHIL